MNPKVNYGLWMVTRCQCRFTNWNTPLWRSMLTMGAVMHVGGCGFKEKISAPSSQFCYKFKTALKKIESFKKKKLNYYSK